MGLRIRYFAAAKAALGVGEESVDAAGSTIAAVLDDRARRTTDAADGGTAGDVAAVMARCSFILNRQATTDRSIVLADGDELDVLPPFAGG